MKVNGCYASIYDNCEPPLSGEHYVPHCILDDVITIQGFAWCKDAPIDIGSKNLTRKILCKKHNSDLSDANDELGKFKETLRQYTLKALSIKKYGYNFRNAAKKYDINGRLIERCFLSMAVTCFMQQDNINLEAVLPHLYEDKPLPEPFGLWFVDNTPETIQFTNRIGITPVNLQEENAHALSNLLINFYGFNFIMVVPGCKPPMNAEGKLEIPVDHPQWIGQTIFWHCDSMNNQYVHKNKIRFAQQLFFHW